MNVKKGYIKPPANPHGEPLIDGLNSVFESLHEHDERGLVLTLAALAEDSLGVLLINYLREEKQAKELVEGFNAPLGTFSSRIKAAFSLGLLIKDSYDTLEVLRKIRNEFAHNWTGVSLDRQDIDIRIRQLTPSISERFSAEGHAQLDWGLRERFQEKMFDVISGVRLSAKAIQRANIKVPLVAQERHPIRMDLVEVDSFKK